jgi:hypothetical protein
MPTLAERLRGDRMTSRGLFFIPAAARRRLPVRERALPEVVEQFETAVT